MKRISWVVAEFTAWHDDPIMDEGRHQHTWRVSAFFNSKPFRDGRSLKASLSTILGAWEGTVMPATLWAGEDIAAAVLQLHGNGDCIGVRVEREEGFGAEVWR